MSLLSSPYSYNFDLIFEAANAMNNTSEGVFDSLYLQNLDQKLHSHEDLVSLQISRNSSQLLTLMISCQKSIRFKGAVQEIISMIQTIIFQMEAQIKRQSALILGIHDSIIESQTSVPVISKFPSFSTIEKDFREEPKTAQAKNKMNIKSPKKLNNKEAKSKSKPTSPRSQKLKYNESKYEN